MVICASRACLHVCVRACVHASIGGHLCCFFLGARVGGFVIFHFDGLRWPTLGMCVLCLWTCGCLVGCEKNDMCF